jgi:hypothetical protein
MQNKELMTNTFLQYEIPNEYTLPRPGHCGSGSTHWFTEPIRKNLANFFEKHNIKSMLDAPCGDFSWMSLIDFPTDFDYLGADLHINLIKSNRNKYKKNFMVLDITDDFLPKKDVIFVRDCLIHMSDHYRLKFFRNFLFSNIKYLMLTSHPNHTQNLDLGNDKMNGGNYQPINWELSPWNFPTPIDSCEDYDITWPEHVLRKHPYRKMCMWSKDQLITVFNNKTYNYENF